MNFDFCHLVQTSRGGVTSAWPLPSQKWLWSDWMRSSSVPVAAATEAPSHQDHANTRSAAEKWQCAADHAMASGGGDLCTLTLLETPGSCRTRSGRREGGWGDKKKQRIITIYYQVLDTSYKIILKTNLEHDFNAVTHPHRCISTIYNVCRLNLIYNIFPNHFNGYPDCLDIFFFNQQSISKGRKDKQ